MSKFVVIEGVDGAGKSTLVSGLVEALGNDGHSVVSTREPGGTPLAEEIRTRVLSEEGAKLTPLEQLELVHIGRVDHVKNKIVPACRAGKLVISDRYELSSWIYQKIYMYEEMQPRFYEMQKELTDLLGEYLPTYIILDLSVEETKKRISASEKLNHFDAINNTDIAARRQAYLEGVAKVSSNYHIVDASMSREELVEQVKWLLGF